MTSCGSLIGSTPPPFAKQQRVSPRRTAHSHLPSYLLRVRQRKLLRHPFVHLRHAFVVRQSAVRKDQSANRQTYNIKIVST